jgi:Sensors of blue-light using FAD
VVLTQLIYWSQPFGFDEAMLNGILMQARRNNARDGLTGALVARADIYVQFLEGATDAVATSFARIRADNRHLAVTKLSEIAAEARLFPNWTMRDDSAPSCVWSAAEIDAGAPGNLQPEAVRSVFQRLALAAAA